VAKHHDLELVDSIASTDEQPQRGSQNQIDEREEHNTSSLIGCERPEAISGWSTPRPDFCTHQVLRTRMFPATADSFPTNTNPAGGNMDRNGRKGALPRRAIALLAASLIATLIPAAAQAVPPTKKNVTIDDVAKQEGHAGTTAYTFTVTMDSAATTTVTLKYATSGNTATAGSDFITKAGSLAFAPGVTSRTIEVLVNGDEDLEPNESFFLTLSGGGKTVRLAKPQGTGTILNDDEGPMLSVSDVQIDEGNSGTRSAIFDVTLSRTSSTPVTVDYATLDATATADDYTTTSGTLNFAAGDISEPIAVPVKGDRLFEGDESFEVSLSNNSANAGIADTQATGTIRDDDPLPSLSVNDVVVTEPDTGNNAAVFTISLSAASGKDVSVHYETADGSALSDTDYTQTSGDALIPAGARTADVAVPVSLDGQDEPDETFALNLSSPVNATLGLKSSGTATVVDDDPTPGIVIGDAVVDEGDEGLSNAVFPVSLTAPAAGDVTVEYATGDGNAIAGTDYNAASGSLTFAPGQRTASVSVPVIGDALDEDNEDFEVTLSNVTGGATLIDGESTGSIVDDDAEPMLSIDDVTVTEGGTATLAVELSAPSSFLVTVDHDTRSGTAAADDYFEPVPGTVSFQPGDTSAEIVIDTKGDSMDEPSEDFFVDLSAASRATIADGVGAATIIDDDKTPTRVALKVGKTSSRIIARGRLEPPRPGQKMIVKLSKKRAGKWVLLRTKRPLLSVAKDANRDGVMESSYKARFAKPSKGRYCKVLASYGGDAEHKAARRSKVFRCR
jgi:large repetitive protein